MDAALVGLVAVPVLAGLVVLVIGRPASRAAAPVAIVAAAVMVVLAVLVAVGRPAVSLPLFAGIRAGLAVDGLSAIMVLTVTAVTLGVVVFAAAVGEPGRYRFFALLLVFAGAMLVTVTATTLVTLLAAWEVMGAMSYALVAHHWWEPRRPASGAVAFLTTRMADVGLYLAAGAGVAGGVGTLALADLPGATPGWRDLLVAGLIVAALGKSAQLPFSFWLSRAMDGPSPVSALLHSATMVAAGGYLLLRVQPLLAATSWAGPVVAWVGAATVVVLGMVALAQTDLKQLLAASTCSQIGFVVLAAGLGATAGGTLQLVAHAATKSLLFLVAGVWLTALGTRQLAGLRGAVRRWPLVGLLFVIGALSLAGVPPLSIFFGKDAVLAAAAEASIALYLVGLLGVIVTATYAAAALAGVLGWRSADASLYDIEHPGTREVPRRVRMPLVALAVAAAVLGVAAEPVRDMLDAAGEPTPGLLQALLSGTLAVAAVLAILPPARAALRTRAALAELPPVVRSWSRIRLLRGWLGLAGLARRGVAEPVLALAGGLAWFDDRVVAGGERAVAGAARALARLADARAETVVAGAVRALAAGGRALGRLARRPQTGQLHHYYAQAAGALAVLALFLVLVR